MARKQLGMLLVGLLATSLIAVQAHAGAEALKKDVAELTALTGAEPLVGALQSLTKNKGHALKVIDYALPLAKKKELNYNAALILGLAAADLKEMKKAESFFRVCMDQALKLQSFTKLRQAYELPAKLYYEQKQYADSARICKELMDMNTDTDNPPIVRATITTRTGEVDFSEKQDGFDTVRRLKSVIFETYVKALTKAGKADQALKMVDNLYKQSEDWYDLHLKGWVLKESGKLEAAAAIYEDVIRQVPKDDRFDTKVKEDYVQELRYEVSNVYVELKKIDRATEHLEYLLKKRPNDPTFYNDLGYIWADNDMRLEEAEKLIRKALELDRERRKKSAKFDPKADHDNGAYLDSLGWVLYKQKKHKEAKEWLLKAVEDKGSQHIEIYDHLGDVYLALGERQEAIRAFEKGLEVVGDGKRDQERKVLVEKKLEKLKGSK